MCVHVDALRLVVGDFNLQHGAVANVSTTNRRCRCELEMLLRHSDAIGYDVDDLPHYGGNAYDGMALKCSHSKFFSSISPQHFRCVSNDVTHFCSFFTLVPHSVGPWRLMVVIMRTLDLIYRFFLFKNLNEMKKKEIDLWKQKASKDITAIWFGYVFWSTPLTL